jgi:hypothetical protein
MYVKNTDKIWSSIEQKIRELFKRRLEHASNIFGYGLTHDEIEAIIVEKLWPGDTYARIEALGDRFFERVEELPVKLVGTNAEFNYKISFSSVKLAPNAWTISYIDSCQRIKDDRIKVIVDKREEAIAAIETEQREFKANTRMVFQAVNSINQLIKEWPAVQELLPKEVIDKVNTKQERGASTKPVIENLNEVSARLLRARVAA